jgi:hypothetical protein
MDMDYKSKREKAEPERPAEHKPTPEKGEEMEITLAVLEKEAPALLEQIRADAKDEGFEAGKADGLRIGKEEGLKDGKASECERIKAVADQSMAGHEALITKLMYDGKTTGPEAAVQVLSAEKKLRKNAQQDLADDAIPPVNHSPAPEGEGLAEDESLPIEERAKAKWDKTANLRAEFGGDYEAYLAYETAISNGQVKILGKGGK